MERNGRVKMDKMKEIISALEAVEPKGDFCARLTVPIDDLQIKIGDSDILKLPLTQIKAKALIKQAKPAKFGWKDQTLQDKNVRDTWEIPKSYIKINKRLWNKTLAPMLEQVKVKLGMDEAAKLTASLHNMLVYEPGQFFQAHQDSEKQDGMVATLVVVLPCKHTGGSLVIDHSGEKKRVQTSRAAKDKLTCVAFYADCHHEVKPLTSGYRVALTYNLLLKGATGKLVSPQKTGVIDPLAGALGGFFSERVAKVQDDMQQVSERSKKERPPKWVYLLDHQYTQKGLNWSQLKNGDRLRVKMIEEAAARLDLEMYMALADIQEVWDCESDYDDGYYRSRRRKYWDYDDEIEDEKSNNAEAYRLNELIESSIGLKYWTSKINQCIDYSGLYIDDSEVCWTKSLDEFSPFSSEYEGWMGNYGNTLERWYHRAAVVLWRKEDRYSMLCEIDPKQAVKELTSLAKRKSTLVEAQCAVQKLLPYWHRAQQRPYGDVDNAWSKAVFTLALQIGEPSLARLLVEPLGLRVLNAKTAKAFAALEPAYGAGWCIGVLSVWGEPENAWQTAHIIQHFTQFIVHLSSHLSGQWEVIDWLFEYQYKTLKADHFSQKELSSRVQLEQAGAVRIDAFRELLDACVAVNKHELHIHLVTYLIADDVLYTPLALAEMSLRLDNDNQDDEKWGYQKLHFYVRTMLIEAIGLPPRKEGDWSITEIIRCSCNDCQELSRYLRSSVTQTKTWPLAKARRQHIHQAIDGMGVPVTHQTKRQGSPHKLMLRKTDELFEREANQQEKTKICLSKLNVFN